MRGWRRHIRISQQSDSQSPRGSFCLLFALTTVCVCMCALSVLFHTVLLSPKWMCRSGFRSSQRESFPLAVPIIFKSSLLFLLTRVSHQQKANRKYINKKMHAPVKTSLTPPTTSPHPHRHNCLTYFNTQTNIIVFIPSSKTG